MKQFKIGLQLYSVRKCAAVDLDATLKAVKDMGYDYVECAGYFDRSPKEMAEALKKAGLQAISVHRGPDFFEADFDTELAYLKEMGASYSAIPWFGIENYLNDFDGTMQRFTNLAKKLKENGIQLLYHNHDFEFKKIGDEIIIDKMYSTIPNELMQPQFDLCWVHYAGHNPVEYLEKYAGKLSVVHLKDFVCKSFGGGPVYELINAATNTASREDNGFRYAPIGSGIQNWEEILPACEKAGAEYLIVEYDDSYEDDPLEWGRKSRAYLKEKFGI